MTRDRGSATVLAVALLAVAVAMGLVVAGLAGLAADRATARSAADLAALAGAYEQRRLLDGSGGDPCAVADRAAAANAAELTGCRVWGDGSVQVTVASGRGKASARAGPESEEVRRRLGLREPNHRRTGSALRRN